MGPSFGAEVFLRELSFVPFFKSEKKKKEKKKCLNLLCFIKQLTHWF